MGLPTVIVTPGVGQTINTLPNGGQALAASSLPVVLASDKGSVTDGTNVAAVKAASTAPVATDPALVVTLSPNSPVQPVTGAFFQATQPVSGAFFQATQPVSAASLPLPTGASTAAKQPALGTSGTPSTDVISVQGVSAGTAVNVAGIGTKVDVTPTVTAATYAANKVMGGIMTFTNLLSAKNGFAGVIESIALKFKGSVQTGGFYVAIFDTSPAGTFTDTTTAAIAAADTALLLGIYHVTGPLSVLGTHTIYNLDGIAKGVVGASANLFAVVVPDATTVALASTTDMSLSLTVI